MNEGEAILGLMAEFDQPELLVDAARELTDAGYSRLEAFTPMPVDELIDILGRERAIVPALVLAGGLVGAVAAFGFMTWTWLFDYSINIGGRPMFSWPAYIPITFEMAVLFGSFSGGLGMLLLNRLPRLHHPVFEVPGFERASHDRFFLMVEADDACFEIERTREFLGRLDALRISEMPCP
jgi:hypothetical protein